MWLVSGGGKLSSPASTVSQFDGGKVIPRSIDYSQDGNKLHSIDQETCVKSSNKRTLVSQPGFVLVLKQSLIVPRCMQFQQWVLFVFHLELWPCHGLHPWKAVGTNEPSKHQPHIPTLANTQIGCHLMIIQFADSANQRTVSGESIFPRNGSEKLEINLAVSRQPLRRVGGWVSGGGIIIRKHENVHVVCEKLFTYKLDKIYGKTFGPKHKFGRFILLQLDW